MTAPELSAGISLEEHRRQLSLLLIEDDRGDAVLVEELIADAAADIRLVWADSMARAELEMEAARPDCVLLDLHLPDANGIAALSQLRARDATIPIVVLTGLNDSHFGVSAVASGAQDYLVKGRVEPELLVRAVLYAIERKRAEQSARELEASEMRARENARLERGLLPSPLLLNNPGVDFVAKYRPSRENALLGGDFYDVVQTPDRVVHVLMGDVSGHGPDEAALGAALRIAWRTLTFAGIHGPDSLRQLDRILLAERAREGTFASALTLAIRPGSPHVAVSRAGHPGMLLHGADKVEWVEPPGGPALGLRFDGCPQTDVEVPDGHALLLLTDGLFEGHTGRGNARLGEEGLVALARSLADLPGPQFVDALIDAAESLAGAHGGLSDDIAVVRVERIGG